MIEEKLQRLIRLEWEEFQNVHNKGSRAPCQDDRKTFWIMRSSLFAPWSEEMIDSWYDDLLTARAEGHELVAEKYAWMMERTAPEEFQQIKHLLKVPSGESLALIAEIIDIRLSFSSVLAPCIGFSISCRNTCGFTAFCSAWIFALPISV